MTDATWTTLRALIEAGRAAAIADITLEHIGGRLFVFIRVWPGDIARLDQHLAHAGLARAEDWTVVRADGAPLGFDCAVEVLT